MRITRIVAALIFSTSLIVSLCITTFAAPAYNDSLYCSYGVAYFAPLNSSSGKWVDYNPTINDDETVFTFSSLPANLTEGNYEYSFKSFAFLMTPNSSSVEFENGYVYTYDFQIRSTRNTNPDLTAFQFGVCTDGFNDVVPLADVIYTYDKSGATTINYYVTVTLNVDDSFPANSIPHPDEAFIYLQIATEWTNTFALTASRLSVKKSVGEGAYYQASLDAIENLPNTEYEFTLNMMPDSQGEVELIKGDIDEITEELNLITSDLYDIIISVDQNEPLIYLPQMYVPFLDIDIRSVGGINKYVTSEGFFRPLSMIESMGTVEEPIDLTWLEVTLGFVRLTFLIAFVTVGIENMIRIEWWM